MSKASANYTNRYGTFMRTLVRVLSFLAIIILILVEKSSWEYSSPLLLYSFILLIYFTLSWEIHSIPKSKKAKTIIAWTSSILAIGIIFIMSSIYTLLIDRYLFVNNKTTWNLENHKIIHYNPILKSPLQTKQTYHLHKFGFFNTLYKEIDVVSFNDTIDYKKVIFPKTGIQFDKSTLKVNVP